MYQIGMKIGILNEFDLKPDYGVIIRIEQDDELALLWLYIKSDTDSMNDKYDNVSGGYYWKIIESDSSLLCLPD